jgi:histidinol-phosphate aminotransferase
LDETAGIIHGALNGAELAALGLDPEQVLDFSSNLNPFGPPPGVRAALVALDPAPYPDRSCYALRQCLARQHHCAPEAILPGNGANELIYLLARAMLRPGDTALVVSPTYGEYAHASELAGATVVAQCAHHDSRFQFDLAQLYTAIDQTKPRITWLCAPNNPTGTDLPAPAIAELATHCARYGGLIVIDRSYAALRHPVQPSEPFPEAPNILCLHSLTKSYALAGLRLGYLLAAPEHVGRIGAYQPAWSVSSAAQVAGLAALADQAFLARTVPQLWQASDALHDGLQRLGLTVWRGVLPFMLVWTGNGAATRAALLQQGMVVRDCASFGLPEWVRVAPRQSVENARLLAAWKELQ